MAVPRSKLVDVNVSRWYHCLSKTCRGAFLLNDDIGDGKTSRKDWIERRLKELSDLFAVSVGGFAILDNHLHFLLRLDPQAADSWSPLEVVNRWFRLHPPRGPDRKPLTGEKLQEFKKERIADAAWIEKMRGRLSSLSWFMKSLKEPLSRMVNRIEECTGAFFEGRFKSIAILDEEALLSVCAYIDLNPVAAGLAKVPEESEYTSVKARVDHVRKQGRTSDLAAAQRGSMAGVKASAKLEEALWLIPIEDRRRLDSKREGMIESFSLGNYLMLVEYTGRLLREGKASISSEVADIFSRLGSSAEMWQARMERLSSGRTVGNFLAVTRSRLQEVAAKVGLSRAANLNGCPA